MKTCTALFFSILLISCYQNSKEKQQNTIARITQTQIADDTTIFGRWTMCSDGNDTMVTSYNVCPVIFFQDNGTGMVKYAGTSFELFNYTYLKEKLIIAYALSYGNKMFPDSVYFATISKKDKELNLAINDRKHNRFYLSR